MDIFSKKDSSFSELNQMESTYKIPLELSSDLVQVSKLGENQDKKLSSKDLDGIVVKKYANIKDMFNNAQFSQSKGYFKSTKKVYLSYLKFQYIIYNVLFLFWSIAIIWNQINQLEKWIRLNETHLSFVFHLVLDIFHTLFYSIPMLYPLYKDYKEKFGDFKYYARLEDDRSYFKFLLVLFFLFIAFFICQRVLYFKFKEILWWFKLLILFWTIYFALGIFNFNLFIWISKFGVPNSLLFCWIIWNIISRRTACESSRSIFWKLLLFYVSPMNQQNKFSLNSL